MILCRRVQRFFFFFTPRIMEVHRNICCFTFEAHWVAEWFVTQRMAGKTVTRTPTDNFLSSVCEQFLKSALSKATATVTVLPLLNIS